jgi:hypothetical protein
MVPEALPAEPVQPIVPLHVLALVAGEGLQRKRKRAEVSSVESGPAPFALWPYVGHRAGLWVGAFGASVVLRCPADTTKFGSMAGPTEFARPMLCLQA